MKDTVREETQEEDRPARPTHGRQGCTRRGRRGAKAAAPAFQAQLGIPMLVLFPLCPSGSWPDCLRPRTYQLAPSFIILRLGHKSRKVISLLRGEKIQSVGEHKNSFPFPTGLKHLQFQYLQSV